MTPSPSPKFRTLLPIISLALLFSAPHARAQAPIEPAQLPARTAFYVVWRGAPSGDIRKTNNLFALWDDPEFAPVRAAMFDNITGAASGAPKSDAKPALTPAEAQEYSALLENGFVLGYITKPDSSAPPKPPAPGTVPQKWNGIFFIYNRTGKEALLS
ncbi:MAG: hypothetical protein JO119_10255, partial [Acidobacteria bacterium]|nr:hypothetical protein [Acidobacteriota bacterium]